jgi:hypothetical protein
MRGEGGGAAPEQKSWWGKLVGPVSHVRVQRGLLSNGPPSIGHRPEPGPTERDLRGIHWPLELVPPRPRNRAWLCHFAQVVLVIRHQAVQEETSTRVGMTKQLDSNFFSFRFVGSGTCMFTSLAARHAKVKKSKRRTA